jgi:acetyl esterase/lipase
MLDRKAAPVSRRQALAGIAAVAVAGCSRVEFVAANLPAAFGAYARHTDIAYGSDPQQRLDVYVPDKAPAAAKTMVVFWYGGRWTSGDKSAYRFVRAALWATMHAGDYGVDPGRVYLMGHSAGAHMAVLAVLDTRYFKATGHPVPPIAGVIGLSGPYDFLPLLDADVQDIFGPPANYPDSQPINFVRSDAPPMLLVHGMQDDTVWPKNSRNLATALSARGVPVDLKLYPRCGHADPVAALSLPARGRAPTLVDLAAFVSRPASS